MMIHLLKIRQCFADPVLSGKKSFEVRYNADRGFQKGDKVRFSVVDEKGETRNHPLNREVFIITYVLSGYGLQPDYVAFGIRKVGDENGT